MKKTITKMLSCRGWMPLMVLFCLLSSSGQVWGGGSVKVVATTSDPAAGLVYIKNAQTAPSGLSAYKNEVTSGNGSSGAGKESAFYLWCMPSRGNVFADWYRTQNDGTVGNEKSGANGMPRKQGTYDANGNNYVAGVFDGEYDYVLAYAGQMSSYIGHAEARFTADASYTVSYVKPVGGSYSVRYRYYLTRQTSGEWEVYEAAPADITVAPKVDPNDPNEASSVKPAGDVTYAHDRVTLSCQGTNFQGWYEDVLDGTGKVSATNKLTHTTNAGTHSCVYTPHANVNIRAEFKSIMVGDASGDLSIDVTDKDVAHNETIRVAMNDIVGTWQTSDFTASWGTKTGDGVFALGAIDYSDGVLVVPFTYEAKSYTGSTIKLTVGPSNAACGTSKTFTITANSKEVVAEQAYLYEGGSEPTYRGDLVDMLAQANTMDNKPTIRLMNDVEVSTPLSFQKSMTVDVNGTTLTSTGTSLFSVDAVGIDVRVEDNSFTKSGVLMTESAYNGVVSVVNFTKAAKLTLVGGTLTAHNTASVASNANAKAYGINVSEGSVFYMTGGKLTVIGEQNATGVDVSSADDYATVEGGQIIVDECNNNAYGLVSYGHSNITQSSIKVNTLSGATACGAYIYGGTTTMTNTTMDVDSKTDNANGVYVANGARLNINGGSMDVAAVANNAYGVYAENNATAIVQLKARIIVNANATACGIYNGGEARLLNASVSATAVTTPAYAIHVPTTATNTEVEEGSYFATATDGEVYGLKHLAGALSVDGGSFKGTAPNGSNAYGIFTTQAVNLKNATLLAETQSTGNTAFGLKAEAAGQNIVLKNCEITAKSATHTAYAIHSNANVDATKGSLSATAAAGATACGLYNNGGTDILSNVTTTATTYLTDASGIYQQAGSINVVGGTYTIEAQQRTAVAAENANVYGIFAEAGNTTVENAVFNVSASNAGYSQEAYGIKSSAAISSTGASYIVSSHSTAYGVYAVDDLSWNNNIVTVSAGADKAYGIYAAKTFAINGGKVNATAGDNTAYAMDFAATAIGTVSAGKYGAVATTKFGPISTTGMTGNIFLKGGFYTTAANLNRYPVDGYSIYNLDNTHDEYDEGYRYEIATSNPNAYVCKIVGGNSYAKLEDALQYAVDNSNTSLVIVMTQSYTLPAGDYRLPAKASLLVPYKDGQTSISTSVARHKDAEELQEHMCLTFATGANLMVDGGAKVEASSKQYTPNDATVTSYVKSPFGRIHMESGSSMTFASGSKLYAWGYITGQGNIKMTNGSEAHELFQITDMKSAGSLSGIAGNSQHCFPMNQYYIQNIEAPTTYYYGAKLICDFHIHYQGYPLSNKYLGDESVTIIGVGEGLFEVTSTKPDAWVRKTYNPATDRLTWDVNSSAKLGSIQMDISVASFDSKEYVLPLTNNMTVHVLDGNLDITQDTQLQPSSSIEVDKTASITIPSDVTVYAIDNAQWGNYAGGAAAKLVQFSPSWTSGKSPRSTTLANQLDAELNVHGKINVSGALKTTAGGANIWSNNTDAGTINFLAEAPSGESSLYFYNSGFKEVKVTSAKLKNGDATFASTIGTDAGEAWGYQDGAWVKSYTNGCFEVIDDVVYAKPSGYVALKKKRLDSSSKYTGVEETNHTYLTADDHILILMDECQWWEVTATPGYDGIFYCSKVGYEGYYEYIGSKWQLVKRNVVFYSDEAGTIELKTIVTNWNGVPDQSVIATNPSKATIAAATYTFYGWKSSVTGNEYHYLETLESAAADMYYTPVFTETPRNYTITFNDADNNGAAKVETAYGTHPQVVPSKPATAQYTYSFKDFTDGSGNHYLTCNNLPTVTGAATYTANWTGITNVYTVIFKDGAQTLQTKIDQPYGTATAFVGVLPTKEADDEFEYAFDGWVSSQNGTKYANGSTPAVSGDVTYTAHYATTARYFITFANYDGTVLQKEATTAGVHPVYNGTPRRDADRDGYFRFDGWMDGEGVVYAVGAALPAVSKKQTYTAQWTYVTTRFTVTFKNFDGNNGSWEGQFGEGETPSYDGATPLAKPSDKPAQYYYEFVSWTPTIAPVTGPATYTAQWSDKIPVKYTITFVYDGYGNSIKKEYAYGATPAYNTGAGDPTPRKDDEGEYSYTFNGWNTAFAPVTGDATYTAQFNQTQHQYTITFVKDNGEPNVEQHYYKNETPSIEDPTKATDAEWSYTFAGWNPAIGPVLYDATYTAQWNQTGVPYNVTFVDENGTTVLKATEPVAHGQKPVAPANPSKAPVGDTFYTFAGWTSSVNGTTYAAADIPAVGTSAVTYTAKYQVVSGVKAAVTTAGGVTTPYTDFATALTAAKASAGSTLKLYANATTYNQTINVAMTLDFNGYTISGSWGNYDYSVFTITGNPVVFMDSNNGNGGISAECTRYNKSAKAIVVNGGKLTIESGKYSANHTYTTTNNSRYPMAYTITHTSGTLVINGGEFTATTNNSNTSSKTSTVNNTATVTINGGKFKASGNNKGTINNLSTNNKCSATGGYYTSNTNVVAATGYQCVSSSEVSGYSYKVQLKKYTLTWNLNGGNITNAGTAAGSVAYTTELVAPVVEKTGYTFNGWDPEVPATMPAANASYTAQWLKTESSLIVGDDETEVTVTESTQYGDLTIKETGAVTTSGSAQVTVINNLLLEATPDNNLGAVLSGNIQVLGDAYIDINMNGSGSMNKNYHYSFAVPFNVEINGGVFRMENGNAVPAKPNTEFRVWTYSESNRATNGKTDNAWVQQTSGTLVPGVFYLLQVATNNTNTYRFKWNKQGKLNNHADINVISSTTGSTTDRGWHGVANNGLGYSKMTGSFSIMQTLNSETNAFESFEYTQDIAMANPVFVQMPTGTVNLSTPASKATAAPRRTAVAEETEILNVRIFREGADKHDDQIFFSASDEALDEYEIGKDVAKMFMGTAKNAQIWINAYENRLVANEAVMVNNRADFALTMFAPTAADYELNLRDIPSDVQVVLLQFGTPIADLTLMPYTISLPQGETTDYSIAIVRQSPNVATGTEQTESMQKDVQKIFFGGKLYIVNGERVYNAQGKLVK